MLIVVINIKVVEVPRFRSFTLTCYRVTLIASRYINVVVSRCVTQFYDKNYVFLRWQY